MAEVRYWCGGVGKVFLCNAHTITSLLPLLVFKNSVRVGEYNVNASLYDIREYFQGRNDKGKMNSKSENETYNALIGTLRENLKILAQKIEPKVYEYEFLKQ